MSTPTPLCYKTLFILCVVIFSEPISLTVLFPFIFFLVESFGIKEHHIGYYVGFIASSFSFAQLFTSFAWGRISDRIGRRPVLLIGLIGNSVTIVLFGFSHSLAWAIATRTACGILNGNVGVAKSVLGEISDSSNRGAAFAMLGLQYGIGMIIGPAIGGLLSWPTKSFPSIFGGIQLFEDNPFLLPCIVSASISLVGFVAGYCYLPETLKKHDFEEIENLTDSIETLADDAVPRNQLTSYNSFYSDSLSQDEPLATIEDIDTDTERRSPTESTPLISKQQSMKLGPKTYHAAIGYSLLAFQNIIFEEILPLWAVALPPTGLGFSAVQIGGLLSLIGAVAIICQVLLYPTCSRYFSALTLYRAPMSILFVTVLLAPLIPLCLDIDARFLWPLLILILGIKSIAENFLFTSVMLLITESAPPGCLGTANGVAQAGAAGVRAIGPAFGGIIWAWSLNNGMGFPFNHFFVFFTIELFVLIMVWQAYYKLS